MPDLQSCVREKKGGVVPGKAVDWAIHLCCRFLRMKTHEDLDKVAHVFTQVKRPLFHQNSAQPDQTCVVEMSPTSLTDILSFRLVAVTSNLFIPEGDQLGWPTSQAVLLSLPFRNPIFFRLQILV